MVFVSKYKNMANEYVYSADGKRLKTIHRTAVPQSTNLSVGQTHTLTAAETHSVDSTEYIGDFQYENGSFKQYSFGDGYITGMGGMSQYKYFIKDHLGNNRIVANMERNASLHNAMQEDTDSFPSCKSIIRSPIGG